MDIYQKEELKNYIDGLAKIFNVVRIVNPIENKVPFTERLEDTPVHINCYDFWQTGEICENCISARSIKENRVITKVEYNEKGAFLVIAKPVMMEGKKYTIEMLLSMDEVDTVVNLNKENNKKIKSVIDRLEENLMIDELTGVYNRRFINKELSSAYEAEKYEDVDKVALIMVDIDDFKEINDVYGHLVGDRALQKVANIIKNRIRSNYDWVARFGGDEFIIFLKNADISVSDRIIKSIQKQIEDTNLISEDPHARITLSFGIHIIEPEALNFERALRIIDENLSRAKYEGKNKAIIS